MSKSYQVRCEINAIKQPRHCTGTPLFSTAQHTLDCQSWPFTGESQTESAFNSLYCFPCYEVISPTNYVSTKARSWHGERMSYCTDGGVSLPLSPDIWCLFFVSIFHVVLQRKAQTNHARDFQKKSIKEKALHLSGLVSGDDTSLSKVTIRCLTSDPPPPALLALPANNSLCV